MKTVCALFAVLLPVVVAGPRGPRSISSPIPCEGHTIKPQICPEGQKCAPTQSIHVADLPGDCVLQSCGGKTREPQLCPETQVCIYNHTVITDIPGRCLSTKLTCGGEKGLRCRNNWDCVLSPQVDGFYTFSAEGICVPPGALVVGEPWRGWSA